jgi:monooxygenase
MRTRDVEHLDVLIVGAGLSGIGAACHLRRNCPDRSFAILEGREAIGGTWDLFRYPGIRSDSDMHTLGYSFAPWKQAQAIADGPSILDYIHETAEHYDVRSRVRLGHHVVSAEWSTPEARWTVKVRLASSGEMITLTAGWVLMCTGYYQYDQGYTPGFAGREHFRGTIVHPQHWPEDLDYAGRRVVVIGSGATAVTLVPAMSEAAEHVTMLQRSPSYVVSLPGEDGLAKLARRWLPEQLAYQAVRFKNVMLMTLSYQLSRRRPRLMKSIIRRGVRAQLPDGYDVDTHFKPDYNPWDQRLCVVPDGDLFRAISRGAASVVTDQVETFTERGLALRSGRELEADVIVTATGLSMLALGGTSLSVDGREVRLPDTMVYKGMMLAGVPNLALAMGYTNASWTLKADLSFEYACRLLNHMRRHGYRQCMPPDQDPGIAREPLVNLASGYVLRSVQDFPTQGTERPWRVHQNYPRDLLDFRLGSLEDGVLQFSRGGGSVAAGAGAAAAPSRPPPDPTVASAGAVWASGRLRAFARLAAGIVLALVVVIIGFVGAGLCAAVVPGFGFLGVLV